MTGTGERSSEEPMIKSTDDPDSGTNHERLPPSSQANEGEAF